MQQLKFKVGDWITTPSIFGYGQITQVDLQPSIVNRYYVEFGASGGSYWMNESELKLAQNALPLSWTTPTTGHYRLSPDTFNLPPGTAMNNVAIDRAAGGYQMNASENETYEAVRAKRKNEGRCQDCGDLLPMSSWGLGECPKHPTTSDVKQ